MTPTNFQKVATALCSVTLALDRLVQLIAKLIVWL